MRTKKLDTFSCGVEYKGSLYITSVQGNALFQYNLKEKKLTYLMDFEREQDTGYLYRCAVLYKNTAWFIPQCADNIAIVNLDTYRIQYIPLFYNWIQSSCGLKCNTAKVFKEHFLCIVPYDIDVMLVIDMDTMDMQVYSDVSSETEKYVDVVFYNDFLYCIPWTARKILQIDINSKERRQLDWKYNQREFSGVLVDKERSEVWLVPAESDKIVIYDLNRNTYKEIILDVEKDNKNRNTKYVFSCLFEDKVFFLPFSSRYIIAVERNSKMMVKYSFKLILEKYNFFKPFDGIGVFGTVEDTNYIYCYNEKEDYFEFDDLAVGDIVGYEEKRKKRLKQRIEAKNVLIESEAGDLKDFVDIL